MTDLTSAQVLAANRVRYPRASVLAVADAAGCGVALIDPDGSGERIVVQRYVRTAQGTWRLDRVYAGAAPPER